MGISCVAVATDPDACAAGDDDACEAIPNPCTDERPETFLPEGTPCRLGPCSTEGVCNRLGLCTAEPLPAGTSCDDGDRCNGVPACDGHWGCRVPEGGRVEIDDHDRCTRGCTIYRQRPVPCRGYDCREDARIWLDFEKCIPNPALDRPEWLELVMQGEEPPKNEDPLI